MSSTFENAFDGLWQSLPSARVTVAYNGHTIEQALSSGVVHDHQDTDEGQYSQADGDVRYKVADEPASWRDHDRINGKVVEVAGRKYRVTGRGEHGGIAVLSLMSEHGLG